MRLTSDLAVESPLNLDKNMELDLNNQTITANNGVALDVTDGAIVKLSNGTIEASDSIARVTSGATLKVESGTYTSGNTAF